MPLQAAIFDLDGVITDTAALHFNAWSQMFNQFLKSQSNDFRPFSYRDYIQYVDGLPRLDGIKQFLQSRHIELLMGNPGDTLDDQTIIGLGEHKNTIYNALLDTDDITVFDTSVALIRSLRDIAIPIAVASSSKNCLKILQRTNLLSLFDSRIDGTTLAERHLPGKPAPDMFLQAAKALQADPAFSVVFEDAVSGVEAAAAGHFGLVVAIDRSGKHIDELKQAGAHRVVTDLIELSVSDLQTAF